MKKFLPYILTLTFAIGILIPTHVAHADWFSFPSVTDLLVSFFGTIFQAILTVMSFVLWLSGQLLNYVLQFTIVNMKQNISTLTGINIAWKVIKDLMNMVFIFMLVYEGIKLIIGTGSSQQIRKFIIGIVLSALLINFSLFFTKVMIDASNVVTISFYNSILGDSAAQKDYGLSNPIVNSLGISSLYSSDAPADFTAGKDVAGIFIMGFGSGIIILVTSFILFAVSILFIIRYVTLIILLMLSPIAYMGFALPQINSYSREWWASFRGQLLFAPIYMIMMWVILILMSSQNFLANQKFTDILNNGNKPTFDSMGLLLNFAVIIGLLIASLVIAKKTASEGSKRIGEATGRLSTFAGGAIIGGTAAVGRRTIGAAGSRLSESQALQNWAGRSFIGEKVLNTTRKVGSGSFDARRSNLGEAIASQTGVNLGKGLPFNEKAGQGGFAQTVQDQAKRKQDYAQTLRGDRAKSDYAIRQADKWHTRQGSRPNNGPTIFGTMGRSNRIAAAKILRAQVDPLETTVNNSRNVLQNLQNRDTQLNQQLANLQSEEASLSAVATPNAQQTARLAQLRGPAATRGSIANINDQITTNDTNIANTNAQIATNAAEVTRLNGEIDRLGLNNPANQVVTNRATGASRPMRADEQNF